MFNWEKWQTNNAYTNTPTAVTAPTSTTSMIPLTQYSIIEVKGPDAEKFLQGQLTCDVVKLPNKQALRGAHCTPKGRIISHFTLYKTTATNFYLRVPKDNAQTALNSLNKYSVFFKVQLAVEHGLGCFSLANTKSNDIERALPNDCVLINIEPMPKETWLTQQQADNIILNNDIHVLPECYYDKIAIEAGWVEITNVLSENLLPHDINMQKTNGISFTKGCYTGQEIIARMEYKATIKKHTTKIRCLTSYNLNIGETFIADDISLGKILRSYKYDKHEDYLIFCNKEVTHNSKDIVWHDLPYAIT